MAAKATGRKSGQAKKVPKQKPVDKKLWPFYILQVLRKHAFEGAEQDDEGEPLPDAPADRQFP